MSAIVDQAEALRGLMQQQQQSRTGGTPRRARTMAITSGKGGVGKTTVAVNLAVRLAQMRRRVVLLDADLGTANADVLCNVTASTTLAHVVAGRKRLEDAIIEGPGGFRLVPGASGLAQMAALSDYERRRLIEQMHALEADADLLLIDTGAGVSPNVLNFLASADEVLVVTTPEPTAITDAYATIKTLIRKKPDAEIAILVNEVRDGHEGRAVFERIAAVCRRFLEVSPRLAGCLAQDPRVSLSVRRRRPFVLESPTCPASIGIDQLAQRLDRYAAPLPGAGLFRRMAHWLTG